MKIGSFRMDEDRRLAFLELMSKPKYLIGFLEILQPLVDINFQESKHIEKISNLWDFSWENTEEDSLRHYDVMKTATVHYFCILCFPDFQTFLVH